MTPYSGPAADTLAIKSRNVRPQRILIKVANSDHVETAA